MEADLDLLFSQYPPAARPSELPVPLGNAGGMSGSTLWKYPSLMGPLLVRAWPAGSTTLLDVERIHSWVRRAAQLPFVPQPVVSVSGRTAIFQHGRVWQVEPFLPGRPEPTQPPTEARLRAAYSALASFHVRVAGQTIRGVSPGLQSRADELSWLVSRGFHEWSRVLRHAPAGPDASAAAHWLDVAPRYAPTVLARLNRAVSSELSLQPCLRDARPEHFLFRFDRVSGLVDFGAMGVDNVAGDVGRLSGEWLGQDRRLVTAALDSYGEIRPLCEAEVRAIDLFEDAAALLIGAHWFRWHFVERRTFDDPNASVKGLRKGVERLIARMHEGERLILPG